jgi:predicted nucleic acid-binding protein
MLTAAGQRQAWDTLARIRRTWVEIPADLEVRETAERLPARYGLKTGDALQLAAALVWCHGFPRGRSFVCGDHLLAQAAENAGFTVLFYEV